MVTATASCLCNNSGLNGFTARDGKTQNNDLCAINCINLLETDSGFLDVLLLTNFR